MESNIDVWIRAGKISFSLRRKGITIPTTDLIIAGLALEYNCSILTHDPHFEKIPEITIIPQEEEKKQEKGERLKVLGSGITLIKKTDVKSLRNMRVIWG